MLGDGQGATGGPYGNPALVQEPGAAGGSTIDWAKLARVSGFVSQQNPAAPFAKMEGDRNNYNLERAKIMPQATTAPGSGGAPALKGWNPQMILQLLQLLQSLGGGARG